MGRTANESVETKPSHDTGAVKVKDLRAFYEQGHSPQETADEFNVEVQAVVEALNLQNVEDAPQQLQTPEDEPAKEE